jgi:hypothetical protein
MINIQSLKIISNRGFRHLTSHCCGLGSLAAEWRRYSDYSDDQESTTKGVLFMNTKSNKVLIVCRKLTGNIEQYNLMLDEWFQKNRISTRDFEYTTTYVDGSINMPNLRLDDENWKVGLIEEEFMKRMLNMREV